MTGGPMSGASIAAIAALLAGSWGCVEKTPIERIPESFAREQMVAADETKASAVPAGFTGIRVEDHQSDSLEDLAFLPGVRVIDVVESSPGFRAGVKFDDIILSVDGEAVNEKGRFDALVRSSAPGRELALEIERRSKAIRIPVVVEASSGPGRGEDIGRVEDLKARLVVRDHVAGSDGGRRVAAAIVRFLPRSPLPDAGLAVGDVVTRLDDTEIESAAHLVYLLQTRFSVGQDTSWTVRRDDGEHSFAVALWGPRKVLTKLRLPILFSYDRDPKADRVEWSFIDLFILSLFHYQRRGNEADYRFLSVIGFSTGSGELSDVPSGASEGGGS
ncbi:MAG: PDZ domain-containing protein [Planctomycetota bacterium]